MSHLVCATCDGYGYVLVARHVNGRSQIVQQPCAACSGTGRCRWR